MPRTTDTSKLELSAPQRRQAMHTAIATQTLGVLGIQSFANGILLLYFTAAVGLSNERALVLLALPNFLSMIVRLPVAHWADRFGRRRFGLVGSALCAVGYAVIAVSGVWLGMAERLILLGILIFSIGKMLFAVTWLALLSDIVPDDVRGRFFGIMRTFITGGGILFAAFGSWLLSEDAPMSRFQILMGIVVFGLAGRFLGYARLPNPPRTRSEERGLFWPTLMKAVRAEGYASFCAYVFLLTLFTAGLANLFALVEKDVLEFSPGRIVMLANLVLIGGVLGQLAGGRAVDRFGTKYVFLISHFGFAALMFLFLMRGALPVPMLVAVGAAHFLLGVVGAASGIAVTTEMLALIPTEHKSLSTSVCLSLILGGISVAGFTSAWILQLGVLKDNWTLWGQAMSRYDALILACAGMIVLLVVTLGLVPSVIRKAEWLPRGQ